MSGPVVWFTGLPSSGKTTLARAVKERLDSRHVPCCVLDSDDVREALSPRPGYDPEARDAFYETLGSLAVLLARQGLVTLVAATAHQRKYREQARAAAPRFIEVHVNTPLETCQRRDAKGLYRRAGSGEISDVPGAHLNYEPPRAPEVVAEGGLSDKAVEAVVSAIFSKSPLPS